MNNHDFKVDDVLFSSWGYDQTNIDFYQVVKVSKSFIWIRQINKNSESTSTWETYNVTPRKNDFRCDDVLKRKVSKWGCVSVDCCSSAYKYDGETKQETRYA